MALPPRRKFQAPQIRLLRLSFAAWGLFAIAGALVGSSTTDAQDLNPLRDRTWGERAPQTVAYSGQAAVGLTPKYGTASNPQPPNEQPTGDGRENNGSLMEPDNSGLDQPKSFSRGGKIFLSAAPVDEQDRTFNQQSGQTRTSQQSYSQPTAQPTDYTEQPIYQQPPVHARPDQASRIPQQLGNESQSPQSFETQPAFDRSVATASHQADVLNGIEKPNNSFNGLNSILSQIKNGRDLEPNASPVSNSRSGGGREFGVASAADSHHSPVHATTMSNENAASQPASPAWQTELAARQAATGSSKVALESLANGTASEKEQGAGKSFDAERFQALLKSLAINTSLVLVIAVGFILTAKQIWKPQNGKPMKGKRREGRLVKAARAKGSGRARNTIGPEGDDGSDDSIHVISSLRLSSKSNLYMVEAGGRRLVVATDQNGIQSMVALTDSFESTLNDLGDWDAASAPAAGGESNSESMAALDGPAAEGGIRAADLAATLERYSLSTVGAPASRSIHEKASQDPAARPVHREPVETRNAVDRNGEQNSSSVNVDDGKRREMEAALAAHGLTDIFRDVLAQQVDRRA